MSRRISPCFLSLFLEILFFLSVITLYIHIIISVFCIHFMVSFFSQLLYGRSPSFFRFPFFFSLFLFLHTRGISSRVVNDAADGQLIKQT